MYNVRPPEEGGRVEGGSSERTNAENVWKKESRIRSNDETEESDGPQQVMAFLKYFLNEN